MQASVYDHNDYRAFLNEALPVKGPTRGARNQLAEVLNCQKGFVSQVLGYKSHFSLEHGIPISRFLKLDNSEEEFFLLLLHLGRAGSKELEKFYLKKINVIRESRRNIKERIQGHSELSFEDQAHYYSSWLFTTVHMCLMIPGLNTKEKISKYLQVPHEAVNNVIDFLLKTNLAQMSGGLLKAGPSRSHLSADSPLVSKHHTNWRMRAINSFDVIREQDIHYSLVMSISPEAAEEMREILLRTIQNIEPVMKKAEDKTIYALNLDLFSLSDVTTV